MKDAMDHAPSLEMAPGLHGIDYNRNFVRAVDPNRPGPNNRSAMNCEPSKVMSEVMGK